MNNACDKLTKWPENVLKILHMVYILAATMLWLAVSPPHWIHGSLILPLIGSCIVLIWYIFEDPERYKLALLIYYIVAAVLTGLVVVYFLNELFRSTGSDTEVILGMTILVFVIAGCASYILSAVLNGVQGKP